jgi:hypothetical protein
MGLEAPSTASQDYGKKCHEFLEQYLKGEITDFPDNYHGRTCNHAKHLLPEPKSGEVEKYFELEVAGVPAHVIGYMDYCTTTPTDGKVILLDHKIVKSDMYLLTPEKLAATNQIITYSKYLLDITSADVIEASYLYVKRGGGFAKKVTVELERDRVEKSFETVADGFRQLAKNYTTTNEDSIPQILSACDKWGGCPFRDKCWGKQQGSDMTSFSLFQKLNSLKTDTKPETTGTSDLKPSTPEQRKSIFAEMTKPEVSSTTTNTITNNVVATPSTKVTEEVTAENLFQVAASAEPEIHVLTSKDSDALDADWDKIALSINAPEYDGLPTLSTSTTSVVATSDSTPITSESTPEDIVSATSFNGEIDTNDYAEMNKEVLSSIVEEDVGVIEQPTITPIEEQVSSSDVVEAQPTNTQTETTSDAELPKWVELDWEWLDAPIESFANLATKTKKALVGSGNTTFKELFKAQPNPTFWGGLYGVRNYGPVAQKEVFDLFEKIVGKKFTSYRDFEALGAPVVTYKVAKPEQEYALETQGSLFEMEQPSKPILGKSNTQPLVNHQSSILPPQVVETPINTTSAPTPNVVATSTTLAVSTTNEQVTTPTQNTQNESQQTPKKATPNGFGKLLLLGTLPMKGLDFNILDDLVEPLEDAIAASNSQPHISMVNFSKGYDQLAANIKLMLKEGQFDWSKPIYVSQQAQITYAKAVSALIQEADIVLKNA